VRDLEQLPRRPNPKAPSQAEKSLSFNFLSRNCGTLEYRRVGLQSLGELDTAYPYAAFPHGVQVADESFLRAEVEPYIDRLYLQTPLLKRPRNSAAIHLLRTFEDWMRFGMMKSASKAHPVQSYTRLRWAHEAIPWALRWIWRDCPQSGNPTLDLDWEVYGEAVELMNLAFKYNHLYRCFTLYSRGFFRVEIIQEQKRIRFFFCSDLEEQRDAASLIYSIMQDDPPVPNAVFKFLAENMPVINMILPYYIEKTSKSSIRCDTPADMLQYFKEWARLQVNSMRFDLPGTWQFDRYSLEQFRSFWMSLVAIALAQITAHNLADDSVGTTGGAIGSLVMQMNEESLFKAVSLFPVPPEAWCSIFKTLIYHPTRDFWDPFWQPIIKVSDDTHLIAPHLVITSSPERNLITLLNRSAAGRTFYNRVSSQKEDEQLNDLCKLFPSSRYTVRTRVPVTRPDDSILTDIDLMLHDDLNSVILLVHAKWLLRPDTVQEVLAKDDEVRSALTIADNAAARITELGYEWISNVLGIKVEALPQLHSIVINRDFVPSGWVHNADTPVVNRDFVTKFVRSSQFTGLDALYAACAGFNRYLEEKYPVRLASDEFRFGDYLFEFPTVEQAK